MDELKTPAFRAPLHTILVVIEEPKIRELVAANLRHAGFIPVLAGSADEGRRLAGEVRPDAVLIDLDSPGAADAPFAIEPPAGDPRPRIPKVMIASDLNRSCGANAEICGATLCLAKPFSPRDLVRSIAIQLRPAPARATLEELGKVLRVGPLELDLGRHTVKLRRDGVMRSLTLAPLEFKLLRCLMEHPERTHSREQILAAVWGEEHRVDIRTVDQYIKRTRRALDAGGAGAMLSTVHGVGYRIDATPHRPAARAAKATARSAGVRATG